MPNTAGVPSPDFGALFEQGPNALLVLSPDLTIVGVTNAYLEATMTSREDIVGRHMFEVFPDNPDDPEATGVATLGASLERVLAERVADTMAVQKYDIRRPEPDGAAFEERFWSPRNSPVLDADGEVVYICHQVVDVTEFVRARSVETLKAGEAEELRTRAAEMEQEVYRRAQEIQRMNAELRVREERYRLMSSVVNDISWDWDLVTGETWFSDGFDRLLDCEPGTAERSVENWWAHIHPDDRPATIARFDEALEAGRDRWTLEYRVSSSTGRVSWLDSRGIAIRDQERNITRILGGATDVTRRREAEQRFRDLLESAPDAMVIVDRDGAIQLVNRQTEALFGYDREALLGEPVEMLLPVRYRSGHPLLRDSYFSAPGVREMGAGRELTAQRADGSEFPVEISLSPLETEAGIVVSAAVRDVTARRHAEDLIREQAALLDLASDAIYVRDLEGRIAFWGAGAARLFGWSTDEALGQRGPDLLGHDETTFAAATAAVLETGEWSGELHKRSKDGRALLVEARWTLLHDASGQPRGVLAIDTDITERRRLEAQEARLQRLDSIGTLAGGIAHDLNNVLTPILASIELLRRYVTAERGLELLDLLEQSSERGAAMVSQVLTFARGVEGRRLLVHPPAVIDDVRRLITDTFPRAIQLRFEIADHVDDIVGDPTQLQQVLVNFCLNARDAMASGGVLTIRTHNVPIDDQYAAMIPDASPGDYVVFEVADTGIGMTAEVSDKIFEPFFTTKPIGEGTGLGLATTRAIVKGHGGFVSVYSEPGSGSTFKAYLPCSAYSPAAAAAPDDGHIAGEARGETVLVVDDEASVLLVTRRTLEAHGYGVLTASDGAEAIATYASHKDDIDLVVSDLMMPVMDGIALIGAIRRLVPDARVVASTGLADSSALAQARNLGVDHYLAKPYSGRALLNTVRQALEEPAERLRDDYRSSSVRAASTTGRTSGRPSR